jgi:hypothetical protein
MTFVQNSVCASFRFVRTAAIVAVGVVFAEVAVAQTWNEVAPPTGKEAVHRTYPAGDRTDVVDVPLRGNGAELEYMIHMKAGDTVVYSWEVQSIGNPQAFPPSFTATPTRQLRRTWRSDVLRKGGRREGCRLPDRALARHPRLVLAKQERGPGGRAPAHGRVLRARHLRGRLNGRQGI